MMRLLKILSRIISRGYNYEKANIYYSLTCSFYITVNAETSFNIYSLKIIVIEVVFIFL